MKYFAQLSLAVLVLGSVWVGSGRLARAQDVSQKIIKEVDYNQTDVRIALRKLFTESGASFSVAPEVQGLVTVSLKNVTLEVALQNITRQVDATYRIEGGVYEIVFRRPLQAGGQRNLGGGPQQRFGGQPQPQQFVGAAMAVDAQFIYVLRGPMVYKLDKKDMKLVKTGSIPPAPGGFRAGRPNE